ncbi:MAG TPA: DUF4403 family protein, partial [Polyangiales bacterium]|nr:DUF4403 family protein [Polyangiales bacterium]
MSRAILVTCLLCCACGASAAEPIPSVSATPTSGAESGPPPLPAARDATFVQSIHVPLALLAASIQAQIPPHESQPRKLLTRPNASPAIEASIEVWRDDVQVRFQGDSLWVDVPLRYAAKFDAKMKNPFGGKWFKVAKDEDWGSERDPQRVTLHVRTRIEITPQWELHLATDIDRPEHGPAPDGKLCTSGAFKLCISKDSFTSEVRRRLEAEAVPRVRNELEKLDRKIEQTVDLRARVERTWRRLTEPRSLGSHDQYSVILPRSAALSLQPGDAELVV